MSGLNSDLVRDSKLETRFVGGATHHATLVSDPALGRRRQLEDERWFREQRLGVGGYGIIWLERCTDGRKKGSLRAVKEIFKPASSGSSPASLDYGRELEAIAKFSNDKYADYFVKSYGWFDNENSVYIAMEYFEHGDLQKYLVAPFPEAEVQEIVSQLAEGLDFMHTNGFTHRDLKPGNILVLHRRPNWWLKIGDFGITKRVGTEATALRTQIGTAGYAAPEVLGLIPLQDAAYSSAVDIWSLGEIAFRLLTNEPTFSNNRLLFDYITTGSSFPSNLLIQMKVSTRCRQFIQEAMMVSPSKRPTASQVRSCSWISTSTVPPESSIPPGDGTLPTMSNAHDEPLQREEASAAWTTTTLAPPSSSTPKIDSLKMATDQSKTILPTRPALTTTKSPDMPAYVGSVDQAYTGSVDQAYTGSVDQAYVGSVGQASVTAPRPLVRKHVQSGRNYDMLVKLLLIGDARVGKSGILLRFSGEPYTPSPITTIGIDFKIVTIEIDGKIIKLQMWDTAGQERFRTITTAYYRGAMGILLVYDVTDETSFQNIRTWNAEIERHATEGVNKILIGNNSDLVDSRVVSTERGQALADELGVSFFEVSSKLNVNIDEAFHRLTADIMKRLAARRPSEPVQPKDSQTQQPEKRYWWRWDFGRGFNQQ